MTKLELIELIILGLIIVAMVVYYTIMAIKNKWLTKLTNCAEAAIKEAEKKFPEPGSGDKKKAYVLDCVKAECDKLGIPYNVMSNLISKFVDTIIKNYNVLKK